jgi:hypothetical protein
VSACTGALAVNLSIDLEKHHIGVRVHARGRQQISHRVPCPDARRN